MKKISKFITNLWAVYLVLILVFLGAFLILDSPAVGLLVLLVSAVYILILPPDTEIIELKYFDYGIGEIQKISVGDWIDLRSAENVFLHEGEYRLLRLGVGMILPDGYEAHVLPRSSTPSKFGIIMANSMGVIDNSYSGDSDEWKFPAVALWDTEIKKGDRIAQFRIVKNQPRIKFRIVNHLNEISRGGIGSTVKR